MKTALFLAGIAFGFALGYLISEPDFVVTDCTIEEPAATFVVPL